MSYQIYLYEPKSKIANVTEALEILEDGEEGYKPVSDESKSQIAEALLKLNQQFEVFRPDEEALDYIELNSSADGPVIQILIFDDSVTINVPYGYDATRAKAIFKRIDEYIKAIHQVSDYFVYDPQLEIAFDPAATSFRGLDFYLNASPGESKKRGWWRFW